MKTKTFDAVEMKRRGQQTLLSRLEGMTSEQQAEFWRQQNEELRQWQEQLRAQRQGSETTSA